MGQIGVLSSEEGRMPILIKFTTEILRSQSLKTQKLITRYRDKDKLGFIQKHTGIKKNIDTVMK